MKIFLLLCFTVFEISLCTIGLGGTCCNEFQINNKSGRDVNLQFSMDKNCKELHLDGGSSQDDNLSYQLNAGSMLRNNRIEVGTGLLNDWTFTIDVIDVASGEKCSTIYMLEHKNKLPIQAEIIGQVKDEWIGTIPMKIKVELEEFYYDDEQNRYHVSFSLTDNTQIDFLALSDTHVSMTTGRMISLIPQVQKFIEDYTVKVVLMPGDLTIGGEHNTLAVENLVLFKYLWYTPISSFLYKANAKADIRPRLLITCGNHDFDARQTPSYPKIIDFINEQYGDFNPIDRWLKGRENYRYAVKIDGLLFISLGFGPRGLGIERNISTYWGMTFPAAGTNLWLKTYLENFEISKRQPIILFFHVPVAGWNLKFMKKKDATDFYDIIKDYNVKAIIVGHTHGNSSLNFNGTTDNTSRDKSFWQIDVSGKLFLHAAYNHSADTLICEFVDSSGNTESISMPNEPPNETDVYDETEGYINY